ncbi:hypothetical protein DEO23_05150 [Brachybacterium endophyticum]|uniref:DUF6318 domain-containing protein n=1 Tax=Brachybacterium endophyticum TaxID=2182385 RepID=A0A2U2RKK5_9MICO|nr:DUF6318 family protein [Brachybacterium endophyticum]PWH06366.1 hypothetical protein DEO23_05150 [Brachybacterium endophyticum]
MKRRTQQIIIAVVALALVIPFGAVGLSQVFGKSNGKDAPSASASPTAEQDTRPAVDPSSQPDPSPTSGPKLPKDALTDQSEDGATKVGTYLLDSYGYMMATGDVKGWGEVVDSNCEVCTTFLSNATQLHEQGGYQSGGEFTVKSASFDGAGDPPTSGTLSVEVTQKDAQIVDDPKKQAQEVDGFSGEMQMKLNWDGSQWKVGDMSITGADGASGGGTGGTGG